MAALLDNHACWAMPHLLKTIAVPRHWSPVMTCECTQQLLLGAKLLLLFGELDTRDRVLTQ